MPKFINNGPNIIFNQFEKLSENETKSFGEVIFYNVPTREKIILLNNISQNTNPKLFNNGKNIILFSNQYQHNGNFIIADLPDQNFKEISITKKLDLKSSQDLILNFDLIMKEFDFICI